MLWRYIILCGCLVLWGYIQLDIFHLDISLALMLWIVIEQVNTRALFGRMFDADMVGLIMVNIGVADMCCSRFSQYDKARKSFGTDEDLLFIFKKTETEQEKSGME